MTRAVFRVAAPDRASQHRERAWRRFRISEPEGDDLRMGLRRRRARTRAAPRSARGSRRAARRARRRRRRVRSRRTPAATLAGAPARLATRAISQQSISRMRPSAGGGDDVAIRRRRRQRRARPAPRRCARRRAARRPSRAPAAPRGSRRPAAPRRPSRAGGRRGRATSRADRAAPPASRRSTASTSSASRRGPMPQPIGPRASVTTTSSSQLDPPRDGAEQAARAAPPPSRVRTLAVGPTGMSISTCVAPTVFFLARIEATICASVSISIGRSTVIRMSSAGARSSAPPQAMQAPASRDDLVQALPAAAPPRRARPSCRPCRPGW